MAQSPPFNQVHYTSLPPDSVLQSLSTIRAPGWHYRQGGPYTILWTHKYMSTAVLIVGIILLLTTLIGGLLLLARSEESLNASVFVEGARTKVVMSGAADQYMAGAIFNMLNQMPPA